MPTIQRTIAPGVRTPPPLPGNRRRVIPRPSRLIIAMFFVVVICTLLVEAYVNAGFAPDGTHDGEDQGLVPAEVLNGGPIINTARGQVSSYRLPPRTITLTFDDGPDPRWTAQVRQVLRRHGVPATFFVVGSQVVRHPDLVRQLVGDGHELGIHTFTHPNLSRLPGWRRRLEYSQTQLAIARAAGVRTTLVRAPYSSKPSAIDNPNWPVLREAGELGYLTVLNDTDSEDWARPGVDAIVRNATPADDRGAITLWHDAGGDRSQTIVALQRFIPAMKARGYRFTTVTEGLNLSLAGSAAPTPGPTSVAPEVVTHSAASRVDRLRGTALAGVVHIADGALIWLAVLFGVVGVLMLARTVLLLLLAGRHARRRRRPDFTWGPPVTAPVSVIVPAYNEKEGIAAAVRSLAGGDHPVIEVIVVDDGSTDDTAQIAANLGLPNVRVVRRPNGGKPGALNTGVALASHDLIVMVDGDTVFEPDSLRRLVQPFADPLVGAVAGNVKVGNRDSLVAKWQHIEYVIGFNLDRRLFETLRCMPTVPGAIGAFRRAALLEAGGMSDDTLAEDTDITMAMSRAGWKVVYEEGARAWTEAPATVEQLWKQRYRWSYGTMQAMWKHRRAFVEPGASGRFGRRGLPFLALFGVLLPLLAPVIDVLAIYGMVFANRLETGLAWLAMLGVQTGTAVVAFRLDREKLRPLWTLPLQQFAYRQVMYLVLMQSAVTALTGARLGWQKLHRTGQAGGAGERATVVTTVTPTAVRTGPVRSAPKPQAPAAGRDRYFDALRALALVRVLIYHMVGGAALSFILPAMGVMFAIAGSLTAHALARSLGQQVLKSRLRRLLPPLWAFGAVVVPVMLWHDWAARPDWPRLLLWVLPLADPPGTRWVQEATEVLWYLVTYLWLVLLSPILLWAYRRWPLRTTLLPLLGLAVVQAAPGLLGRTSESVVVNVTTFGACWVVGFAHRDGSLRRMSWPLIAIPAVACVAAGVGWAYTHPTGEGLDLNEIPIAQGLYSLGFVLVLLRMRPPMDWLSRVRPLDRLVSALNARAVTVYLWHNPAIAACFVVGEAIGLGGLGPWLDQATYLAVALVLLAAAVLLVGWVEDLAAARPPRLLPGGTTGTDRPSGGVGAGVAPVPATGVTAVPVARPPVPPKVPTG